jgi:chromosome segregation ATPase
LTDNHGEEIRRLESLNESLSSKFNQSELDRAAALEETNELRSKIDFLNISNMQLTSENQILKESIKSLNQEIERTTFANRVILEEKSMVQDILSLKEKEVDKLLQDIESFKTNFESCLKENVELKEVIQDLESSKSDEIEEEKNSIDFLKDENKCLKNELNLLEANLNKEISLKDSLEYQLKSLEQNYSVEIENSQNLSKKITCYESDK